eukprot:GHVT01010774.1.p1 GENE.GHVT01010774.1~~GHVT01010774.1.p1  ORF type:complete len:129 (+),score=5.19 GHVT01010774.1:1028-1414(+)
MRAVATPEGKVAIHRHIHYSNVMLLDPVIGKPTRVKIVYDDYGNPIRISKRSGNIIPWPEESNIRYDKVRSKLVLKTADEVGNETMPQDGPKDTPVEIALEKTYDYWKDSERLRMIRQMIPRHNRELH